MDHRMELVDVIRRVRNRWRLRLAARGAVVVVAGTVLALLLSASGLESFRFSAPAIIAFRIIARRRVRRAARATASSGRCAAASPTRRSRCTSRNAIRRSKRRSSAPSKRPPTATSHGALAAPRREARRAGDRRSAGRDRRRHARSSAPRCSVTSARWRQSRPSPRCIVALGPAYLRHGLSALLVISRSAEASSPYSIEVKPGNTKVPRGADQAVSAKLVGFSVERRQRDDAHRADGAVRARAARSPAREPGRSKACCSTSRSRPSTSSSRTASARRRLLAGGRRTADRLAARCRVPLPRLHRSRAAQGRRRRRRGRDPRHRSAAAHRADDGDAGRPDSDERRRRRSR